jgi:hypothetical protein
MIPTKNNILPANLGNYGPSYTSNDNIPNPWTMMIPNPYYPRNLSLTFSNTFGLVAYPFLNMYRKRKKSSHKKRIPILYLLWKKY